MYKETVDVVTEVMNRMETLKCEELLNDYELLLLHNLKNCMTKELTKIHKNNERTRKFIAEKRKIDKNYCR